MKLIKILFVICIISIAALGGSSYWLYSSLNQPHQHSKTTQFITIEKGSTPNEIINKLSSEGIL